MDFAEQIKAARQRHPGMVLMFRMGDFFEMYEADALLTNRLLGLTLTSRHGMDMAGFPHQQLETYLHKLLKEGIRVAVCEQETLPNKILAQRIIIPDATKTPKPDKTRKKKAPEPDPPAAPRPWLVIPPLFYTYQPRNP